MKVDRMCMFRLFHIHMETWATWQPYTSVVWIGLNGQLYGKNVERAYLRLHEHGRMAVGRIGISARCT